VILLSKWVIRKEGIAANQDVYHDECKILSDLFSV
jgi:hypothetical protein